MMITRSVLLRLTTLTALVALLVAGCATTAASPPEVTVTHTVSAPAAMPAHGSTPGSGDTAGAGSDPGEQVQPAAGSAPDASVAPTPPAKTTRTGPPTTIIVGRPTIPDPATENPQRSSSVPVSDGSDGDSGTDHDGAAGASSAGGAADSSHTGTPPGSLSTDGDLIAAATSAAAAAGVAPADPDTPGPETGPVCAANHSYVDEKPTGLRSDVITAWHRAVSRAAAQGITLCLNDGKRSRAQQQAQYDAYVQEYGKQVADPLVLQPNKSAHVVGIAVDVQPATAYRWLQSTDGSLGFCRIYDNEAWHFEFNPTYRSTGCPARLPEPER
jgi:hypothetical protein